MPLVRFFLKVTISSETNDKLQRLRALMRHSIPDGDLSKIVDRALTMLLAETERTKFAQTSGPRTARETASTSRHIPAAVRREVWRRDGGRCGAALTTRTRRGCSSAKARRPVLRLPEPQLAARPELNLPAAELSPRPRNR